LIRFDLGGVGRGEDGTTTTEPSTPRRGNAVFFLSGTCVSWRREIDEGRKERDGEKSQFCFKFYSACRNETKKKESNEKRWRRDPI
jgi:hypothetical protein